jgi:hypothetical protein
MTSTEWQEKLAAFKIWLNQGGLGPWLFLPIMILTNSFLHHPSLSTAPKILSYIVFLFVELAYVAEVGFYPTRYVRDTNIPRWKRLTSIPLQGVAAIFLVLGVKHVLNIFWTVTPLDTSYNTFYIVALMVAAFLWHIGKSPIGSLNIWQKIT